MEEEGDVANPLPFKKGFHVTLVDLSYLHANNLTRCKLHRQFVQLQIKPIEISHGRRQPGSITRTWRRLLHRGAHVARASSNGTASVMAIDPSDSAVSITPPRIDAWTERHWVFRTFCSQSARYGAFALSSVDDVWVGNPVNIQST